MLANILCLNFTILCMTEEEFHWKNFTIDVGIDVFDNFDFESAFKEKHLPKSSISISKPSSDGFNFPSLGIELPSLDSTSWLKKSSSKLARHNPQLFFRLLKIVAMEIGEMAVKRIGEKLDPRNIDFNGFNLTKFDESFLLNLKEYLIQKLENNIELKSQLEGQYDNISEWRNIRPEHIELINITWDGVINGRIKIIEKYADHYYSSTQKSLLLGIIAFGALLAIPLISIGIKRFGCRKIFTIVGFISSLSTAICPCAAFQGFIPFLIARLIQGIGFAVCFPVIGAVTSEWASLVENGLFNGMLTSFIQLAPVITMPLSGTLCSAKIFGWQFAFYAHSLITLGLISLWWIFYRDTAIEHQSVNDLELRLITEGKSTVIDGRYKHNSKFPFKSICTNKAVWAICVAAIGNMFSIQMMIMSSPIYIREVLHYATLSTGFAAAFPTLLQLCVKIFAGILSDKIAIDETLKVKIFNSIAFCGMAFFLLLLSFTQHLSSWLVLSFIILSVAMLGFNTGGFFKSSTLVGRQYAYFICAKIQIIMCISMLLVPSIVYSLTPNVSLPSEWARIFIGHAILLFVCNGIFCVIGSGKAAIFTSTIINKSDSIQKESDQPMLAENGNNNEINGGNK